MRVVSRPLISIGVPVYNETRFLRATLDSLISQTYADLEMLVTDNGSTDDSAAILAEYAARDPRIRIRTFAENRGAVASFNDTLERATGQYFQWAGAHDRWHPQWLERAHALLNQDTAVVGVYPHGVLIDANDQELLVYDDQIDTRGLGRSQRYTHLLWNIGVCNMIHGLWRREVLAASPRFTAESGTEKVVLAYMNLQGAVAHIPDVLFYRREVRGLETRAERDRRMMRSYDPTIARVVSHRQLIAQTRSAHWRMLDRFPLSTSERLWLKLQTWYIFAIRHHLFPGGMLCKRLLAAVPRHWKQSLYPLLQRGSSRH